MLKYTFAVLIGLMTGASIAPAAESTLTAEVRPAELGSTARVHEFDGWLLAGQPSEADLALARERGVKTVITLRAPGEPVGFDERTTAEKLGLKFENLPIAGATGLTDATFDEARKLLSETKRPALLHCGSANRVGAVWLPWRVLDGGQDYDAALAEAKKIGLTSPQFEAAAKAYIEARKKP